MTDAEDQIAAIRWAFEEFHFIERFHEVIERQYDRIDTAQLRQAAKGAELLEEYPDRPHGLTKLLLAYVEDDPLHIVVNVAEYELDQTAPIAVVTVYKPEPPFWMDERTRGTA